MKTSKRLTFIEFQEFLKTLQAKELHSVVYSGNDTFFVIYDQKEVKRALKRESKKVEIPTLEMVLNELEIQVPQRYMELKFSMKSKYEEWCSNHWRDGYNKPIINWKLKIKSIIPYLKSFTENADNQTSSQRNNGTQSKAKRSMLYPESNGVFESNEGITIIRIDE